MPIPGARGLYGGWVKGKQDKQSYRHKETVDAGNRIINVGNNLNNIKNAYTFQEYLQRRSSRDTAQEAQDMENQEFLDDENTREAADVAQRAKDKTTADTAEGRTDMTNAVNEARQGQAETTTALQEEAERLQKVKIEREVARVLIGQSADKVDALSQILGSFGDENPETGLLEMDEEGYAYAYKQMEKLFGEDGLEELGLTQELTPDVEKTVSALRRQSVHTVETQIKEHLMDLERQWDLEIASAKANGQDMQSVIGKMSADKMKNMLLLQSVPPGSLFATLAKETIGYLDSAMLNLTTDEGMEALGKVKKNFKQMLIDVFPTYGTELADAGDRRSSDKGLAASSEFIHNVFNQLNEIFTPQKSMELISVMYEYDTDFFGNGFQMRSEGDELGNLNKYYEQVREVGENMETALFFRSLGPAGQKLMTEEILKRMEEDARATKRRLEGGRPFISGEEG